MPTAPSLSLPCPHCGAAVHLRRRAPAPPPADQPHDEFALAGPDGQAAASLLALAKQQGMRLLTDLAGPAVDRLLTRRDIQRVDALFTPAELADLAAQIAATTATAELLGRSRLRLRLAQAGRGATYADTPTDFGPVRTPGTVPPLAPAEAVAYFTSLVPGLTVGEQFVTRHTRQAFTLAATTDEVVLGRVKAVIQRALETGESGVPEVQAVLDGAGVGQRGSAYAELVFRVNMHEAYLEGSQREYRKPDVRAFFPGWRYAAIRDGRERPHHGEKHGRVYPAEQDFRDVRGRDISDVANCRCCPVYLTRPEWKALQAEGGKTYAEYDPEKHPRDNRGRFITTGAITAAKADPAKAAALRARVAPGDRHKLDALLGGGASRVPEEAPSAKALRAKAAHVLVDKSIQRYAEEHNEPRFARAMGGVSFPDSEPFDVAIAGADGRVAHMVELKTMTVGKDDKLTMNSYAQVRKVEAERQQGATFHTVVSDDRQVYNANGPGRHDDSQRVYYYRRGVAGSARIGALHRVEGGETELKRLMAAPEADLPPAAQRTDGGLRVGRWKFFTDEQGKGYKNSKTGQVFRAKK